MDKEDDEHFFPIVTAVLVVFFLLFCCQEVQGRATDRMNWKLLRMTLIALPVLKAP